MSVTTHRANRKAKNAMPQPEERFANWAPAPAKTDAELAASWAAQALLEGRFELGRALATIAAQAHRVAEQARTRPVPMLGTTRDEAPAWSDLTSDEQRAAVGLQGPTGNGDADIEAIERDRTPGRAGVADQPTEIFDAVAHDAQTAIFGRPDIDAGPPRAETPPSGRCVATMIIQGVEGECHNVAFWQPATIGDAVTAPKRAGWTHMNPELDADHEPLIRRS